MGAWGYIVMGLGGDMGKEDGGFEEIRILLWVKNW